MDNKNISDFLQNEKEEGFFQEYIVAHAPAIMAVFANLVVIAADVRAYHVINTLTGIWWQALYASLACAVPFMLWEIAWNYNHTTERWRFASLLMAGLAFFTSILLGIADYLNFTGAWTDILLVGVVVTTGLHTVVGLLYYYNDPDVARRRHRKQALATMNDQALNAETAGELLRQGSGLLDAIRELEKKYPPEEVERVLAIVKGKRLPERGAKPTKFQPARTFSQDETFRDNNRDPIQPPRGNEHN